MPSTGLVVTSWKNSGTIWVRPPILTAKTISRASRPTFFSMTSCFIRLVSSGQLGGRRGGLGGRGTHGAPGVPGHQQHAAEEDRATDEAHDEARVAGHQGLDE